MTRSQMCSLSCSSCALYRASAVRIATRPHSEHSFNAMSNFCKILEEMTNSAFSVSRDGGSDEAATWMSVSAVTAFATTYGIHYELKNLTYPVWHTIGLLSETISCSCSKNPLSITSSGRRSYSFATHKAAVLRTYGFSSRIHFCRGSQR